MHQLPGAQGAPYGLVSGPLTPSRSATLKTALAADPMPPQEEDRYCRSNAGCATSTGARAGARRKSRSALVARMPRQHATDIQLLPRGRWSRKKFLEALADTFSIHREPLKTERRTQYDTADWQLSLYRLALCVNAKTLVLRSYEAVFPLEELTCPSRPAAATDVPPSRLRERLVMLIDDLPLAPLFSLHTRTLPIRILDQRQKTTVRLIIEEHAVAKKNQPPALRPRIWVHPLRGYQQEAQRLVLWCKEQDLIPTTSSVNQEALATAGRSPGKYSVKRPLPFQPGDPVERAVRRRLRLLLAMVRYNERGLRQGDDSLYLHDFRVAVRRARSLLGQTREVFPPKATQRLRKALAQLGRSTGRARDLDAFLLVQAVYRQRLPADRRSALQPFFAFLQQERREHYQALVQTFETKRYRAVIREWEAFASQPEADGPHIPTVKAFVLERVVEKYRALVSIEPNSLQHAGSERLHRLRIDCKKLRYLLDFFITALPELPVRKLLTHLKRVQRTLGRIQDISVQSVLIQQFCTSSGGFAFHENGTRPALEALLTSLTSERQELQPQVVAEFRALAAVIAPLIPPLNGPDRAELAAPQDQPDQPEQAESRGGPD